jgi:hypothetical protein
VSASTPSVSLRDYPHPYAAMFAICSDLDETLDAPAYARIVRFLNTDEQVEGIGPGVGLEIGNTIYFHMGPEQFSYWNTGDAGREMVRAWIRSGHIDCFHSYGDLALTRRDAAQSLEDLARHGCSLRTWVDHGTAVTNFGGDIMAGHGDVPGHAAYHADLTIAAGVRYVWRGRVTSVVGQGVPRRLTGIFRSRHALASLQTTLKEGAKGMLARAGSQKYAAHGTNRLLTPCVLRDGQPAQEFLRSNPHWGGVSRGDTGFGLAEVVSDKMLQLLVARRGICILYTHLGKARGLPCSIPAESQNALRVLRGFHDRGEILVATTTRILDYVSMRDSIRFSSRLVDGRLLVEIAAPSDTASLQGLTFTVPGGHPVVLVFRGNVVEDVNIGSLDADGNRFVTVPWRGLCLPRVDA